MNSTFESNNNLLNTLQDIISFLTDNKIEYCLIGGLAVQVHGEPRFTRDIDICVLTDLESREVIISKLLASFDALFDNPKDFALANQILPLLVNEVTVDISFGLTGFEKKVIERAQKHKLLGDFQINIASAEDLVVYKCLAARPKDIQDIDSILSRNKEKIDLSYVRNTLKDFEAALNSSTLIALLEERIKLTSF